MVGQQEIPKTLIDYFPKDFLMFIDESHVTFLKLGLCMLEIDQEKTL